jgi:hypothetical protein
MTDTIRKRKYEFICQDDKCMEDGTGGCVLSFFSECGKDPEFPNYCPYELEPKEHKYVPWRSLK